MYRPLAVGMVAILIVMLTSATPARSQGALEVTVVPAFEGNYTPGAWLPVTVRLRNAGAPATAIVAAALPDAPFRNLQPVELAAGAEKQLTLYVAMEQATRELRLTVTSGGALVFEQELAVRPRTNERMLGILASQNPGLNLPRRQDLTEQPFTSVSLDLATFPDHAAGLSSLGLLLLSDVSTAELSQGQREALLGWVSAGGHLIIGGGPTAARTLAGLAPQLQPAALGGDAQIGDQPLAALAGAEGPGPLPGVLLAPGPEAIAGSQGEPPAWATRQLGVGAVTQLAFDPGLPALAAWPGAPQFWDRLLRPPLLTSSPFGLQPGVDSLQEGILAGALTATPTINLPPADLIFGLLALYAVVVGPGLALLLRRADRQALSWIAVPALALVTGALIFGLAFGLRADQRVFNQLTLVEGLGGGQARVRSFVGGLVPQSETMIADTTSAALARPVRGATGQYGGVSGAGGDLAQLGGAVELNLEAWRLQGLFVDGQAALAGIDAELTVAAGQPGVVLRNTGELTLREAVAVYGEQLVRLGDVGPGGEAAAVWPQEPAELPRGTPISALVLQEELAAGQGPGRAPDRAVLAREALINAAVARGQVSDDGPFVLAWLDSSPLPFALRSAGAASRETTLLVLRPTLGGSGPVTLPAGWLRADLRSDGRSPCFGEQGAGITIGNAPLTVRLALPPALGLLQAEGLTLTLDSTDPWPNAGVTTSLYDWTSGAWVEQEFDGPGDLAVAEPAAYVRGGELLLRLDGLIPQARCLYAQASLQGRLP